MPVQIKLSTLEQNLAFFSKMYDVVRLVDPIKKTVLEYGDHRVGETGEICYDYWKNGKICDNCISVRAFHDNKSYMKLEQNPDVIMLVTAMPIEAAEGPVILELLKNATDSMMVGTGDYNSGQAMHNIVRDINNMVIMDHLTSIYNRRFVDGRLPVDIVQATVKSQPLSVIFIDINNMKKINDAHGHTIGDTALKNVAAVMQKCIRTDVDWVARYGGDEFIICLNNIDNTDAYRIAERVRESILSIELPLKNDDTRIEISFGIQTMSESALTADEIIRMADEKMYENKNY